MPGRANNKRSPVVSVIIPTYNHKDFIKDAIESVLQQTFQDFEVIVADDASNDGTATIVKSYAQQYPEKIKAVIGDRRLGIAGNINRALRLATGKYIAWLGGDDLMYPTKLEKQVRYLEAHPEITGCHHDADVYDEQTKQVVGVFSELYSRGNKKLVEGRIEVLFDPGAFMLPSTMMFRRNACPPHGFDERLRYANDWLFDIETFRSGRIGAIKEVLGVYRRHGGNVTSSADLQSRTLEESFIVLGIIQARYPELGHLAKRRRVGFLIAEMIKRYRERDYLSSFLFMKNAWLEGSRIKAPALYLALKLFGNRIFKKVDVKAYHNKAFIRRLRNYLKF
ncbi:glycosyltransferase [Candidatus Desulforudis audaxviator]|uniref:Glycosyl transferase, family 2 n=1 Tax=Desulforudis audaxviator (strain MP104C) TaxID=477974 RepID=B1I6V1_DESAP|nr:glycosyltransferase [Candidatus Desulforudis audaxviator]ACA60196.1 glycosyl transferase, family 2 [Candidatus Desulforudis audaxviator MP104C]AZK60235.1 glycosyl transferase, family 2 [Candidatus Desulforudis audaxviator]